jgi:hypothetical protein
MRSLRLKIGKAWIVPLVYSPSKGLAGVLWMHLFILSHIWKGKLDMTYDYLTFLKSSSLLRIVACRFLVFVLALTAP